MPDLFRVTASIIGVTVPALHNTQLLLNNFNKIINALKVV
jgi:hypothetical protein